MPNVLKISIGHQKGRALTVYKVDVEQKNEDGNLIHKGPWCVEHGFERGKVLHAYYDTPEAAARKFWQAYSQAPISKGVRKREYYTFVVAQDDGSYAPDFAAIDSHDPQPTSIDIMFQREDPLSISYQMWSASKLRCYGDGHDATRITELAEPQDREAAEAARANGDKRFPIIDRCWKRGCKYAGNGCKPSAVFKFQLCNHVKLTGTAFFTTNSVASIKSLFSGLELMRFFYKGSIIGIPVKMSLSQFKTNPVGQRPGTAYKVSLEPNKKDAARIQQALLEQSSEFAALQAGEPVSLEGGVDPSQRMIAAPDGEDGNSVVDAELLESDGEVDATPVTESEKLADKTAAATEELKAKVKRRRKKKPEPKPEPEPDPTQEEELARSEKVAAAVDREAEKILRLGSKSLKPEPPAEPQPEKPVAELPAKRAEVSAEERKEQVNTAQVNEAVDGPVFF